MNNAPTNQQNNQRSITTGKLELRKLWSVPQAEFIYALFVEVKVETCEMETVNENDKVFSQPNWDKIVFTEMDWRTPQGYVGDEEWARRTAEHFEIEFPTEEYKADDKEA